ncbi:predicted protein [Heterostelium album PN500]|uniref:Gamma-glutamyltransferase n=1 Tax=Heterostelium pallidum (strain ATCC 26659 / Pp 5 / PN500) TaxID=670386 RepID=D3BUG6_HETP5|nr:predicted protein [Heterostelium album PN500]EFA74754.1 predicted protein [Heterostelium album PN500]|eukprot:XP_020426888.1 predicted protein [Heterostelium album PN500]
MYSSSRLKPDNANELLCDGKKPEIGDTLTNVPLSNCLKLIAKHGKDGFYKGEVADSIIKAIQDHGGLMTHADLESHKSTYDKPISINYRGYQIYELPPTSQGITSLMALNILEGFEMNKYEPISDQHTHLLIESMRLSYADAFSFVSDPEFATIPIDELLSKDYAASRRSLINEYKANDNIQNGYPLNSSNTVCASVVDKDGNVCCLFNSIFMEFGSGIIPKGCGFALQNRGCWFNLDRNHPNCLQPGKRPYHTVMPTMILDKDGEFYASIGIIGGIIQPVANVQAIVNLIDHKMDPQTILNFPRFRIENSPRYGLIDYESDFENTFKSMKERGHNIGSILEARIHFGWGQIIVVKKNNQNQTVLIAGSDNRSDGIAIETDWWQPRKITTFFTLVHKSNEVVILCCMLSTNADIFVMVDLFHSVYCSELVTSLSIVSLEYRPISPKIKLLDTLFTGRVRYYSTNTTSKKQPISIIMQNKKGEVIDISKVHIRESRYFAILTYYN